MIRHNLFWKIVSLLIAIALYAYVNAERNPRTRKSFAIPIEVRNLAKNYEAAFVDGNNVDVTIEGLKPVVDSVTTQDIQAWVSLGEIKAGRDVTQEIVKVRVEVARIPKGALTLILSPLKAMVRVEVVRWKQLPVEIKLLTTPPLGYAYSDPIITPAAIGVSGKISALARVKKVVCAVSSGERDSSIDEMSPVSAVDSAGDVVSDVTLDTERVRLKMRFVESAARKMVIVSPEVTGEPKFPARVVGVSATPSSVTVEGRPNDLINLSALPTESISIQGATGTVNREVELRTPTGVRIVGQSKVRVTARISSP